jgi:CubicO group peptidase (beta-lactamase class C family)
MRKAVTRLLCIVGPLGFAIPLFAAGAVPNGKPEDAGFSTERLGRIKEAVQRHIDAGSVPGVVTLVARRGKVVHFETHGFNDVEAKKPMPKDAIFRLASMSKPIGAVAVMMMVEEGKVRLNDPVSRFIPEFKQARVAMPKGGAATGAPGGPIGGGRGRGGPPPEVDLVPSRAITVRDLLTHTSGLMSGGPGQQTAPEDARQRTPQDTLATYMPRLGAVALDFQPGTQWRYSGLHGFDVLCRIVEVASGMTIDRFMQQRLFDPLGMKDTGFTITAARQPRMAIMYRRAQAGPSTALGAGGFERQPDQGGLSSPTYFSCSGGMISTAEDYLQFAQMLVNGGELNGKRYLSPKTIELLASNHTGDLVNGQFGRSARGMGFGLGVQVVQDPVAADLRQSKGTFGWAGAYGTNINIDPQEKMVNIIMMQTSVPQLQRDFENAVMQAIID